MASTLQNVAISEYLTFIPSFSRTSTDQLKAIYEQNRQRIYAMAFWMTDSEPKAEQLLEATFIRAFSENELPTEEQIDEALIAHVREEYLIGILTLNCADATEVLNVRGNTRRVHLELAVVQLPATEKLIYVMHDGEGYSHERIARTLGISEKDSQHGLHQARLRIRELVSKMAW
jgi:RNA polymerase sigma-70 factor (ECF subfamily)